MSDQPPCEIGPCHAIDCNRCVIRSSETQKAYGGTAAARRDVECECQHPASNHEGDEYGFCLACECNHYRPVVRSA